MATTITWTKVPGDDFLEQSDTKPVKYRFCVIAPDGNKYCTPALTRYANTTPTPPQPIPPSVPTAYKAITDRTARPKPPLPSLGAAGFLFTDPTFGSKMLRVTDAHTRPGLVGRSFRVPSSAHATAWNATSTGFYVTSTDGAILPYAFDAATMTAVRLKPDQSENGGLTIPSQVEPSFSRQDATKAFVNMGPGYLTLGSYNLSAQALTPILDLTTLRDVGDLTNTYVGGLLVGGVTPEVLVAIFGGPLIDAHHWVVWQPLDGSAPKLLDTLTLKPNFHLHAFQVDRTGRYVLLYPAGADRAANPAIVQVYVWDVVTGAVTGIPNLPSGHDSAGFANWINQDCCTATAWDAAQWQFRSLAMPNTTRDLIPTLVTPKEIYLADHTSWHNAQPGTLVPVISSLYRYRDDGTPWRAWDDEVVAIDPNGTGTVWRFAHHRSDVRDDRNPDAQNFWYEPMPSVSPDGKWVLVTSNWEKSLGMDSLDGAHRQDVFLIQLTPA